MPIVEGVISSTGPGSVRAYGEQTVVTLSSIEIGSRRLGGVRFHESLTGFEVGDNVRLLYYTPVLPINGYRHMAVSIRTDRGVSSVGYFHMLGALFLLNILLKPIMLFIIVGLPWALLLSAALWLKPVAALWERHGSTSTGFLIILAPVLLIWLMDIYRLARVITQMPRV